MKIPVTRWPLVGLLSATATASYICRVNLSTAAALLIPEFGFTQTAMGRIFSAFLLGYALFQIPAGALADRWGARRTLKLAAWLWVALTAAQSLIGWGMSRGAAAAPAVAWLAVRFLLGIAEAPTYPAAAQGVATWSAPQYRGRANGLVIASIGVGSALASPLVSSVMLRWGWRWALIASALPALVVALIWSRAGNSGLVPESRNAGEPPSGAKPDRQGNLLRTRSFLLLTASYTLQGYVGYIFVFWFYLYLVQERHFGMLAGAWVNSMSWILSILSIPLGGFVSDRLACGRLDETWGRRIVPMAGMSASGILIALGAHTQNPSFAALSLAMATACVLCVEGPFWATMLGHAGASSGRAGGIMNMGSNLGGLISPVLTPLLASTIGWENALHVAAALALLAAVLWLVIRLDERRQGDPGPMAQPGEVKLDCAG